MATWQHTHGMESMALDYRLKCVGSWCNNLLLRKDYKPGPTFDVNAGLIYFFKLSSDHSNEDMLDTCNEMSHNNNIPNDMSHNMPQDT